MKVLSLYIDKWYIVGTVKDGANNTPLSLSNAEDRIWLYFYSNSTTNAVKYSRGYKDKALAGEKGYYADVFDLLPDYKEYHYEKYGARKKMSEIFADADIFDDLKKSFGDVTPVPVYLAFSEDVDIVAQHLLIERLKSEQFDVLHHTLPIECLALEHLARHGKMVDDDGNALIVNACNENLRYSIYSLWTETFSRVSQKCEPGYGVDSRKQAVVEEVMDFLQDSTRFLTGKEDERNDEMLYLSQFADLWLKKIDSSFGAAPVAIGNIHFRKQPNNDVPVTVSAANLNDRTKNIVEKLTGKIVDLIKESHLLLPQISNVVFLGDMFSNHTFAESLQKKIGIATSKMEFFRESELPEIVASYDKWDENAFEEECKRFVADSRSKYAQDRKNYVELQTHDLKEEAQMAESKGLWQDAIDKYQRVLRIDSDDAFSKARISVIQSQIEQDEKNRKMVEELLEKARENFRANDFDGALKNCDEVLRIQPQNADARKIKDDIESILRRQQQMESYIAKMKEHLTNCRFFDAANELQKADELRINDVRLKDLREQIESGIAKLETEVEEKTNAYEVAFRSEDYQRCIRLCEELLNIGADSAKWTKEKTKVEEKQKQKQVYDDNYELARQARMERNWSSVIDYAQKALNIKECPELREWIREAEVSQANEELSRIQEDFSLAFANEQWRMVVEIYLNNEFLRKKSSNSTMYDKARRNIRKEGISPKTSSYTPSKKHPEKEHFEIAALPKTIADDATNSISPKKIKPYPVRPNVSTRPQFGTINIGSKRQDAKKEHPRPNRINTIGSPQNDNEKKGNMQINKIINKPKR